MAEKYIVTGTTSNGNGTEEVILARDEETGEPTKWVSKTHPEELTKEEKEVVESCGVVVEKVSKDEAAEIEAKASQQAAATDTAAVAPVFDQGTQQDDKAGSGSDKTGSGK